jgi:hypothetical protein
MASWPSVFFTQSLEDFFQTLDMPLGLFEVFLKALPQFSGRGGLGHFR